MYRVGYLKKAVTWICLFHIQCDSVIYSDIFVLAQWGYTALLRSAGGGSVPLVRALLKDYGSSVDELTEVSTEALPS